MLYYTNEAVIFALDKCSTIDKYQVLIAAKHYRTLSYDLINMIPDNISGEMYVRVGTPLCRIRFKNGSEIRMVRAQENARGYKCNLLIVEDGVEEQIVRSVLQPTEIL